MKRIIPVIMCFFMLCSCVSDNGENESQKDRLVTMERASVIPVGAETDSAENGEKLNYDIQKAVWISYIDLAPMLTGKNEEEFENSFSEACKNVSDLGCNTIYVHVRPFGDAIYHSSLYPPSRYMTGRAGEQGDFDPLEIMTETAHQYKLSFHAWINPLRCENEQNFTAYNDSWLIKQWYDDDNGYVERVDGDEHLWLNPAYEDVRKLIADGAAELAEKYDIDGIHYDDYFYPTTDESFDAECFAAQASCDDLQEWRLNNISQMVKEIYSAVKAVDSDVLVGVSPQGNIENNYEYMYADVKKWCREKGYIDYICPQIYFGYNNSVKPYIETLEAWQDICTADVELIAGLAVYKIGEESEFSQTVGIISEQIDDAVGGHNYSGAALYNYLSLFESEESLQVRINEERESIKNSLEKY